MVLSRVPKVSIVILNWNGYQDTLVCLKSLERLTYPRAEIIVVDNGSADDSERLIRKAYPKVNLIQTGQNLGFAGGNNVGIRAALELGAQYIMLLNNDTVVEKNFLEPLVWHLEKNKSAGAVQPKLMRDNQEGVVDSLGQEICRFIARDIAYGQKENGEILEPKEIFGPCAAAALFRKEVFEKVGLLDPRFFMVFEDVDFSWRMREKGYSSWLIPNSVVFHKRGVSGGTTNEKVSFHAAKNKLFLKIKYYPFRLEDYRNELRTFLILLKKTLKLGCLIDYKLFIITGLIHRLKSRARDRQIYQRWASDG
jgi:GT2 family glycosyltransferase